MCFICVCICVPLKLTENPMMRQLPRSQSLSGRDLITTQPGYLPKVIQLIKDRGENPTQQLCGVSALNHHIVTSHR